MLQEFRIEFNHLDTSTMIYQRWHIILLCRYQKLLMFAFHVLFSCNFFLYILQLYRYFCIPLQPITKLAIQDINNQTKFCKLLLHKFRTEPNHLNTSTMFYKRWHFILPYRPQILQEVHYFPLTQRWRCAWIPQHPIQNFPKARFQ